MNIVLLVNSHNLPAIREFVEAAALLQAQKTAGAISVVYQQTLGAATIETLVAPLLHAFSAASSLPVPIASSLNDDGRNATLFALFIAQVYARYPGPWLIVDGPGIPKVENFVVELEKQHKILDGKVTGRASTVGSGITPVGPVVLDLPVKDLKWFSPGASESWRARARFLLGRCGFRNVPLNEYLFSIPKASTAESVVATVDTKNVFHRVGEDGEVEYKLGLDGQPTKDLGSLINADPIPEIQSAIDRRAAELSGSPVVALTQPKFKKGDWVIGREGLGAIEKPVQVKDVFCWENGGGYGFEIEGVPGLVCHIDLVLTQEPPVEEQAERPDVIGATSESRITPEKFEQLKKDVIALHPPGLAAIDTFKQTAAEAGINTHLPDSIPANAESCAYDNLSDEDLRTQIEIRDLPKPHHFTGRARLLAILCENDDARKAQD